MIALKVIRYLHLALSCSTIFVVLLMLGSFFIIFPLVLSSKRLELTPPKNSCRPHPYKVHSSCESPQHIYLPHFSADTLSVSKHSSARLVVSSYYLVSSVANVAISSFAFCALFPINQVALPKRHRLTTKHQ